LYFSNFLAAYNQSDLFKDFEFPLKYALWMDIYAYHLEHPQESQWRVSLAFGVSKYQ